jgi:hypothetical protein
VKEKTNQFCLALTKIAKRHSKALANVVMALSSQKHPSVVSLSESRVFRYQYSSICDAISHLAANSLELEELAARFRDLALGQYWEGWRGITILQTDKTAIVKSQSPTLKERQIVATLKSSVPGNRPIDIGYDYSFVNIHCQESGGSFPLSGRRIELDQTPSQVAVNQVKQVMYPSTNWDKSDLVINTLDRAYATATYVDGVKTIDKLVSIVRFRTGAKVYEPAGPLQQKPGKCTKIFGQCYYLQAQSGYKTYKKHPKSKQPYEVWQTAITDKPVDEELIEPHILPRGRRVHIHLKRWNDLVMRTKDGIPMHDKPFTLLSVEVFDELKGHSLFERPMFLGAFGNQAPSLSTRQIYEAYRARFGIEFFFRFAKGNLLLNKFQTPDRQHLDNWVFVVILAAWLLYTARKSISNQPKKWQQYNLIEKLAHQAPALSPAQVHKAILPYLLTFDPTPFLPLKYKPGPGRRSGQLQIRRTRFPYCKKKPPSVPIPP